MSRIASGKARVEHDVWRYHLYVPGPIDECPAVGDYRITSGEYEDEERFRLSDYWRSSNRPDRCLSRRWKGSTEFHQVRIVDGHGAPNSAARWLTPRGPGIPKTDANEDRTWITQSEDEAAEELARRSSVESPDHRDVIRPLESRMKSAEKYDAPRDVEDEEEENEVQEEEGRQSSVADGLGHHGDPEKQSDKETMAEEWHPPLVRVPREPTQKEREVHEATHLPHAEWCEFCMRGRARNRGAPERMFRYTRSRSA